MMRGASQCELLTEPRASIRQYRLDQVRSRITHATGGTGDADVLAVPRTGTLVQGGDLLTLAGIFLEEEVGGSPLQ